MSDHQPYEPYPEDSARREYEASVAQQGPSPRPPSIKTAVLLMRIGAGLGALYLVLTLTMLGSVKDDIRDQLQKQDTSFTQSDLDTAYTYYLTTVIIIGLVGVALWLWMAAANGRGKSWARITATVLGGINILISVLSVAGAGNSTPLSVLFSVVNLAVAISALVFMYRRDAKQYYAAMSRR